MISELELPTNDITEESLTSIIVEPDKVFNWPLGTTRLDKVELGTKVLSWFNKTSKKVGGPPVSKEPVTE